MRLKLLSYTQNIEPIIATALLTTSTPSNPIDIYRRLLRDPEKLRAILNRVELHHGSLLEHNQLCWLLEASKDEVLEILMKSHFFYVTPLGGSNWLLSSNLRTALRYVQRHRDAFSEALLETIRVVAPNLTEGFGGNQP
ncbi:hypothetical protein KEJ49_06325 [Candidatus Bathyarchaeota archaeon]|nr:hypothetical protein [Candidatus Bathyarchaeota archaeon]